MKAIKNMLILDGHPAFLRPKYTSQPTKGPTIPIDTMFAPKVVIPP